MSNGILITGAAGFLGSALSRKLMGQDRPVHRLVRSPLPSLGRHDTVHVGSLEDIGLLRRILPQCGVVVHLASATTPGSSATSPSMEAELNLLPTLRLLDALHEFPDVWLVVTSSGGTLYGTPATTTVTEAAPVSPLSYHGTGKLAIEAFLQTFHHLTGQDVTVLRPSNLYGPGQSLRQGFGLIRNMLDSARCGKPIDIWGDGESVRDFLYIDDMVDACCRAILDHRPGWQKFNVGSGEGHSVNQIRQIIQEITGLPVQARYHPARPGDVRRIVLDCAKFHADLGWNPAIPLTEGIRRTWQWLQSLPPEQS